MRARDLHPRNSAFEWSVPDRTPTTITEEQRDAFDRDGFFVMRGAVDTKTLGELTTDCDDGVAHISGFLEQLPGGRISVAGLDTQVVAPHLVMRSPRLKEFCDSELFTSIWADLFDGDPRLYWEQAVYKAPHSAEPVLWHQDNGYTYVDPQGYLTCWIALTDATLENGCISVMPGAHRDGTLAHEDTPIGFECWGDHDAAIDVPVSAGDIVVFSSLTPHATRVNTTDEVRKAYIVQHCHADAIVG